MNAANEFRAELAAALTKALDEAGVMVTASDLSIPASVAISNAVVTTTADWSVSKGAPKSHEHPLYDGPDMVRFRVHTKPRELNADEVAERDRWMARSQWKHGPNAHEGTPPDGVTTVDLLEQKRWWVSKDGRKTLLKDMHPSHRANTLALLERSAVKLHLAYASGGVFAFAPDEVHAELENQDPRKWLSRQPLVKRLRKMVKADRVLAGDDK